jgi:hypothetical protein
VVGSDEAALDAEREAVGPLEPQEVGRDRRELPQHHLTLPPLLFQQASSEGPEGQRSTETPAAEVGGGFGGGGGGRSSGSATFPVRERGVLEKKRKRREGGLGPTRAGVCLYLLVRVLQQGVGLVACTSGFACPPHPLCQQQALGSFFFPIWNQANDSIRKQRESKQNLDSLVISMPFGLMKKGLG